MATGPITRVTMIKLASEDSIPIALEGFKAFASSQKKEGEPYILSMQAGRAEGSVREQGYNFVTKSVFRSMDDMRYYENDCPAHNEYRVFLKKNAPATGLQTVYFTAEASFEFNSK
ncbi:Dabb family protein [Aspergillus stella-maris]|uniref:Dabb family protein n=1 Tax=Aspergillus stella-maris TaxID=1810926 RepID=UPI003CCDEAE3